MKWVRTRSWHTFTLANGTELSNEWTAFPVDADADAAEAAAAALGIPVQVSLTDPDEGVVEPAPDPFLRASVLSATFVRPGSVGDRLRKAAATAAARSFDVMTSPPTITTGTSNLDAALTKQYRTSVAGRGMYRVTGGTEQQGTGGYAPYVIAPVLTRATGSGGNTPSKATHDSHQWRIEFMTDAPDVMLRYFGSTVTYMVRVDDQPASAVELAFPGAGMTGYTKLAFGSSKVRKITVELQYNVAFDGVYVGPTYTIWKPTSDTNLKVAHVGDSIGTGTGNTKAGNVWTSVAGNLLGWTDVRQVAYGGTGFVNTNGGAANTFGSTQRVADVVAADPDLLLITASGNDDGLAGVQAAAIAAFQAYRTALPDVPIVAMGAFAASTGPSAARQATEDAVKAAFDQWADPNSVWIPNTRDLAGSWDTGTGYVGATAGNGNRDRHGSDAAHPNNTGHAFLGSRFVNAFRALVLPVIP